MRNVENPESGSKAIISGVVTGLPHAVSCASGEIGMGLSPPASRVFPRFQPIPMSAAISNADLLSSKGIMRSGTGMGGGEYGEVDEEDGSFEGTSSACGVPCVGAVDGEPFAGSDADESAVDALLEDGAPPADDGDTASSCDAQDTNITKRNVANSKTSTTDFVIEDSKNTL